MNGFNENVNAQRCDVGKSFSTLCDETFEQFCTWYDAQTNKPNKRRIEDWVINNLNLNFSEYDKNVENNALKVKTKVRSIPPATLAEIILHCEIVRNIILIDDGIAGDSDSYTLGYYISSGEREGTYTIKSDDIRSLVKSYSKQISEKDIAAVIENLRLDAKHVWQTKQPNLTAVNNGIYNNKTHSLEPFNSDYVFLYKIQTNYNPDAQNVLIDMPDGEVWDCDSQLKSFGDNEGFQQLLKDTMTACVYPYRKWDKAVLPYGTSGNNGKGTFCEMIRNIVGHGVCADISIKNLSKDFYLSDLLYSCAIVTDENDVGTYIDSAETFKCLITGDPVLVNRKFKDVKKMVWNGFMIQCINELPRFKDKTESLERRIIILPFESCFKDVERSYIKHDYIAREDVREYYLKMALENDIEKLEVPEMCLEALEEFKGNNDPIYRFYQEQIKDYEAWDCYPIAFIWEHYKAWYKIEYSSNDAGGSCKFKMRLLDAIRADKERNFEIVEGNNRLPANSMNGVEPNIIKYNLEQFMSKNYNGDDPDKLTNFKRPEKSRCYLKRLPTFNQKQVAKPSNG